MLYVYTACHRRAEAFKSSGQDGLMTWYLTNNQRSSGEVEALMGNEGRTCPGGKTSTSQGPELGRSVWGRGGWRGRSKNSGGRVRSERQAAILRLCRFLELVWRVSALSRGHQSAPVTRRSSHVGYWARLLQGQGGSQGKNLAALRCPASVMVAGTSMLGEKTWIVDTRKAKSAGFAGRGRDITDNWIWGLSKRKEAIAIRWKGKTHGRSKSRGTSGQEFGYFSAWLTQISISLFLHIYDASWWCFLYWDKVTQTYKIKTVSWAVS